MLTWMDYNNKYTKHYEQLYEWILFYNAILPVKNKPKNYLIVHNVQSSRINVTKQQNITSNNYMSLWPSTVEMCIWKKIKNLEWP